MKTMKTITALAVATSLTACSGDVKLTRADYADAATTAVAVSQGFVEGNPVIGIAGDAAAPLVALGVKYAAKEIAIASGATPEQATRTVNAAGMLGTCNNVALLLGVTGAGPLLAGAFCAIVSYGEADKS